MMCSIAVSSSAAEHKMFSIFPGNPTDIVARKNKKAKERVVVVVVVARDRLMIVVAVVVSQNVICDER